MKRRRKKKTRRRRPMTSRSLHHDEKEGRNGYTIAAIMVMTFVHSFRTRTVSTIIADTNDNGRDSYIDQKTN